MSLNWSIGLSTDRPITIVVSVTHISAIGKFFLLLVSALLNVQATLVGGSANERLYLNLPSASVHRVCGYYLL